MSGTGERDELRVGDLSSQGLAMLHGKLGCCGDFGQRI